MSSLALEKETNTLIDAPNDLSLTENRTIIDETNTTVEHLEHFNSNQLITSPTFNLNTIDQFKQMILSPSTTNKQLMLNYSDEQIKLELQKQLEYYFSSKNLQNDSYLRSQMDQDDYVAITLIAQFKRIKQLTRDLELINFIIKQSTQLQLDSSNTRVRSVGGRAGGLITINTSFTKKVNKSFILNSVTTEPKLTSPGPLQQRCILIMREVSSEATLDQVKELFTNKEPSCPSCLQCESAGNDSWYVTFNNEEEAQKALQYLKGEVQLFMDKPIRARIKTHTTIPRSTSSLLNKSSLSSSSSPPPLLSQTSTNFSSPTSMLNRTQTPPVSYNQQILSYETPSSSSYMSNTSSPSPATMYLSATNSDLNQAYHDGVQLVVQKPDYDIQSISITNQSQQINNYLNYNNNQSQVKYFPNGKQLGLIGNQQYMFPPNAAMNSPNGTRPIILPANIQQQSQNNQYWQLNYTKPTGTNLKYNNNANEEKISQLSPSNAIKQTSLSQNNTETKSNESLEESTKVKINEIYSNENYLNQDTNEANNFQNNQTINQQIPNFYQPHHQQQQMIQIPMNANSYNRSSPAAIQAYYQAFSQSPSQQYVPAVTSSSNSGQIQHALQQSLLSSASNSSLNSNNQTSSSQQIPYSNLPGVYPQTQFIIQNMNQQAQLMVPGLNQNYYNSNSNKSSTPTPAGPTSSGSSSNGTQQITSPSIYNSNPYFITTNLSLNNSNGGNSNNNNNVVSTAALNAAVYQYYHQAYNNAPINTGFTQQQQQQQYNTNSNQNLSQGNSSTNHANMPPNVFPGNQQQLPFYYELVQSQFDGSQVPIQLAPFQPNSASSQSNMQSQNQTNEQSSKSSSSTPAASSDNTPQIPLNNLIQHQQNIGSFQSQNTPPPASLFIYNNNLNNQNAQLQQNLMINPSSSNVASNASTSQLLMTTLANSSSTNSSSQLSHHSISIPSFNGQSSSNNLRRVNSGNNGVSDLRNIPFNSYNHATSTGHYQSNSHRNYNSNTRVKYLNNNEANLVPSFNVNQLISSNNHQIALQTNNSPSYQSNKLSHNVNFISESSSRSSTTTNTPLTTLNPNESNAKTSDDSIIKSENEKFNSATISKSPPNNSDLISFPPLLNANVSASNQHSQLSPINVSATNDSTELASVQLDPAIICISNSTIPSSPALYVNSPVNKYAKTAGSLNKILTVSSENSSKENSIVKNLTNQATILSSVKHHQGNIKQYDIIKSHLGFNRTTHLSTSSNPDYYVQQKQANQHHQSQQNSQASNQTYNNTSNAYKAGPGHSRKSIDGIYSQSSNQRINSHQGVNSTGPTLATKFYSNNNSERTVQSSGSKSTHNRQNFSTNHQNSGLNQGSNSSYNLNSSSTADNKSSTHNPTLSSVIKNENSQHSSSPSFNRKQKSNSYQNKNSSNSSQNSKETKFSKENNQSGLQSADQSNFIQTQSNSSLISSTSSLQNNEEDLNSLSSNSWNNKKLTFAEIVQQKTMAAANNETKAAQNSQLPSSQQDGSNGCSTNVSSSESVASATSSQATTPNLQPQNNTPFPLTLSSQAISSSFTEADSLNSDQKQAANSCFALNHSNSTSINSSSIQV